MSPFAHFGIAYAVSGFLVGFVVGLTGTGGGSLMTPVLVLVFGVHPATAVGTDLLYAAITKACGAAVHHIGDTVAWRLVGLLALGSLPASLLTLLVLGRLHVENRELLSNVLSHILGAALLLTTLSLFLRRNIIALAHRLSLHRRPRAEAAATILLSALLGALVSATSVGAGAIGVTAMVLLYPHFPIKRIVGTDVAHAVPLTLTAGIGHLAIGTVNLSLLVSLLLGSLPGIALGSWIAPRAPERALRVFLAIMLALVGARLVIG
ncbi:MAG TPA: sulfite exporter TauE/SafE family protein [Stellaceae bacterium]|nr:sulfite exporter TauE/SafE family protein [Stellaceae bacterium]